MLGSSLGAGPAALQWIIAGYSLTFGLALVPMGRLGDAYGRKWFFAGGVALFTAASVAGGLATSPWLVAAARLAQGAGAGTYGVIQDLFTGRDRTRALGAYATVGGLAGIIGPLVGGVLLGTAGANLGWRLVLLLNVPFGLATVPLAAAFLPASRRPATGRTTTLDLPGLALLAAATLALLLPFVLPAGPGPPRATWALVVVAVLAGLGIWERRYARSGRVPILMPELLARRGFILGVGTAMFQFGASLSTTLVLTLHLAQPGADPHPHAPRRGRAGRRLPAGVTANRGHRRDGRGHRHRPRRHRPLRRHRRPGRLPRPARRLNHLRRPGPTHPDPRPAVHEHTRN